MMKIVVALPPNYQMIAAHFPISGRKGIWFTFGDIIYNPDNITVPPPIVKHEEVHMAQQSDKPDFWWTQYCVDKEFRLNEELAGHRAEYEWYARQSNANDPLPGYRSLAQYHLTKIAQRLSGPIYGGMISTSAARRAICAQS